MHYRPVEELALGSRASVATALCALLDPLLPLLSPGGARLRIGDAGANSELPAQELEAFSRMLWGLAPLLAGGGQHPIAARVCDGLRHGTDPRHPEYWGAVDGPCIRAVEMAPLGFALALCPAYFTQRLRGASWEQLCAWLRQINTIQLWQNNWLFFRVLVNLGFARTGQPVAAHTLEEDFRTIETWYLGDGWYSDGATPSRDYYIAFAFHFYSLIYAALSGAHDAARAAQYKERAALFAREYIYWFGTNGASFPFGRSLTYRFAVACFWGALAFAGVEALPWGVIKGLYLRNLRWWLRQPIFSETGLLTLGYCYPNLNLPEAYSGPGSPYWACKAFLPLALPAAHPFWRAPEEPLPPLDAVRPQPHARMVICRDDTRGHVVALAGGQLQAPHASHLRYGAAKYAKFAYSNVFGFSLPLDREGLVRGAYDSMLALSDDGQDYRVRGAVRDVSVDRGVHYSRWSPLPEVEVATWLIPAGAWHVRVHHLVTPRALHTAEGGFALGLVDEVAQPGATKRMQDEQGCLISHARGCSGIRNLHGHVRGELIDAIANSNLMEPQTCIPMLTGQLPAGRHVLVCAVLGLPGPGDHQAVWEQPPAAVIGNDSVTVAGSQGPAVCAW